MKLNYLYILIVFIGLLQSCDSEDGETVESAYVIPPLDIYQYKFSRNGRSTVDLLELELVNTPMDYIYTSYLKPARISSEDEYSIVMDNYKTDLGGGIILENQIATSDFHSAQNEQIKADLLQMINQSGYIAGYGSNNNRGTLASVGVSGYIGDNINDLNVAFVNAEGLEVAQAFRMMMFGAIHLDKTLNKHLDLNKINDSSLRNRHENLELVPGKNYTALEHHWDLAYGYYKSLKPLIQSNGLSISQQIETKIFNAFVYGRYQLGKYNYDEVNNQISIIKKELSKAIAIKTMQLLIGENTLANLNEEPTYAFTYLSRAYGLIYALQFTRNIDDTPYFTYSQVRDLQNQLMSNTGLWQVNRLLGNSDETGSLKNIAQQIGQPFNISLENIKR